jgi:hypothetical protein
MWRAYRKKYGSLFFGRRIEQGFGNWTAHYTSLKIHKEVDPLDFMLHEHRKEVSLEEYMMANFGEG